MFRFIVLLAAAVLPSLLAGADPQIAKVSIKQNDHSLESLPAIIGGR
jgi:hypothetical protein